MPAARKPPPSKSPAWAADPELERVRPCIKVLEIDRLAIAVVGQAHDPHQRIALGNPQPRGKHFIRGNDIERDVGIADLDAEVALQQCEDVDPAEVEAHQLLADVDREMADI